MTIQDSTSASQKGAILRAARSGDAAPIAKLGAYVFSHTFAHSVEAHELQAFLDEAYTLEAIAKDLDDGDKDVIVAVDAGNENEILGFAFLTRNSVEPAVEHVANRVELQRIYVDPKAHGMGVGSLLSREMDRMAREQGFAWIWLGVWEENYKALRAYERWGYRIVGKHDFCVGPVVQTDHVMLKEL